MPERISALANAVKSSPGFEDWRPTYTPDSLNALGDWLATQIQTRLRTEEKLEDIAARSPFPIERPNWELTNRMLSLAMDIGMYLSQVFLKNHLSLKWDQPFGSKSLSTTASPS